MNNVFNRKSAFTKLLSAWAALSVAVTTSAPAFAAGTEVLGGNSVLADLTRVTMDSNTPDAAVFSSTAASGVLDWTRFNIGAGQSMTFDGASTTFFNLVDGAAGKSQIDGIINGNGNVWVINPAGVAFGAGSKVDLGGLFAAAAGNIENAIALRDGTATLPEFSSLDGGIAVGQDNCDATVFVSERVMMLAKSVKVDKADMSNVNKTSLFAFNRVLLDEVEGGGILVQPQDFFSDDETGAELGDILAGSMLQSISNGKIDVDGDVSARDTIRLTTGSGNINISEHGCLSTTAENGGISLLTAQLNAWDDDGNPLTSGDITVDGKITAGMGGINMTLGGLWGSPGNVTISGEVETAGQLVVADYYGDVEMSGRARAGGMNIETGIGDVTVKTDLDADYLVRLGAYEGDITVAEGASVTMRNAGGQIEIYSSEMQGGTGSIYLDGDMTLEGDGGFIQLKSGHAVNSTGDVVVNGNIVANGAGSNVSIFSGYETGSKGNVEVNGHVETRGENSYVAVFSGYGNGADGSTVLNGSIEATGGGEAGVVYIYSGYGAESHGDIVVNGSMRGDSGGNGGGVQLLAGFGEGSQGSVSLNGSVVGDTGVAVYSGWGDSSQGDIAVSGNVKLTGGAGILQVYSANGEGAKGNVEFSGTARVEVSGDSAVVDICSGVGKRSQGNVSLAGDIILTGNASQVQMAASVGELAQGSVNVSGTITASGANSGVALIAGYGADALGTVDVSGSVAATGNGSETAIVGGFGDGAVGSVSIGGDMAASRDAQIRVSNGDVAINGTVEAGNTASVVASSGSLSLGGNGVITAGAVANVLVDGDVAQTGNEITVVNGLAGIQDVSAGIKAETINLSVGGNIGSDSGYLGVDGKVYALVGGHASLAAANGTDFRGGDSSGAPSTAVVSGFEQKIGSLDKNGIVKEDKVIVDGVEANFSGLGGTSAIVAKGNLSIYTGGKLEANGLLKAGGDITVSASDFGDVSYLQAGGRLAINNVGNPSHPKIAYFESVNGVEPNINNQPNDTVIFVDGRLAGGNLKVINEFGSDEAFMVDTPELKSTQGIFGSPTFMHSDLDVANPMEVGVIDYMIQEVPRLTLSSDFPADADQSVEASGLSQRDVYWFGQKSAD